MSWLKQVNEWSPSVRINEAWGETCPTKSCGVFRLIGIDSDSGDRNPVVIDRTCGRDTSGTLYIGEGSPLDREIGNVIKSLVGSGRHNAGVRLRANAKLTDRFRPGRLAISWCLVEAPACGSEDRLMRAYADEFGELPPLNAQGSFGPAPKST